MPHTNTTQLDYKKIAIALLILIIVLGSFIGTGVFFYKYNTVKTELDRIRKNPGEAIQKENQKVIDRIRTMIDVPENEQPTVEVINDLQPLKNQQFFARAKIGDRLIIFTQSKKAILYDPTADKIIEVGPVSIPTPAAVK